MVLGLRGNYITSCIKYQSIHLGKIFLTFNCFEYHVVIKLIEFNQTFLFISDRRTLNKMLLRFLEQITCSALHVLFVIVIVASTAAQESTLYVYALMNVV